MKFHFRTFTDHQSLQFKYEELIKQNESLKCQLFNEQCSFVEERDRMNAKILELEAMNDELLAKDFEIGKMESEVKELTKTLEESLTREAEIQKQLEGFGESE